MTISVLTADRFEEGRNMLWLVLEKTDGVTGLSETFHALEAILGRGRGLSADPKIVITRILGFSIVVQRKTF